MRELMAVWDDRPVYYMTTNVQSAIAIGTDQVRNVLPWNLDGEGLVQAQAIGNAPQFGTTRPLVCDLPRTASSVAWNWPEGTNASPCWPECWYTSPDIAAVIQEIVNRPDWSAGNAIAIIYSGTNAPAGDIGFCGYAVGSPFEGRAPTLEITYAY